MDDDREHPLPLPECPPPCPPHLFAWRGNGVVLFGEQADGRWVVVRGWLVDDTLTSVRRWSFAAAGPFCGQVRRLVREATCDEATARENWLAAQLWAATRDQLASP